jgi:hypothetical protein
MCAGSVLLFHCRVAERQEVGNLNTLVFSLLRARKSESPPTTTDTHTHQPTLRKKSREGGGALCLLLLSAPEDNTMCSDIGTTSRVCAAYSFTGILFTVSVVRLASLPRFLLDHDSA